MLLKGYGVFRLVFLFTLPMISFVFCYWRILMVIRRQNKVTAGSHASHSTRVVQVPEAASTSAYVDGKTISNVKTGQGKIVEHGNRYT